MSRTKQAPPVAYGNAKQSDLATSTEGPSCPTCGRPWAGLAVKICRKCGESIAPRHRFSMIPVGPGVVALEHGDCESPEQPKPKKAGK